MLLIFPSRKLYCIKVSDEDRNDPAYGIEPMDTTESPEVNIFCNRTTCRKELQKGDYQLITLYKADDPSYENNTLSVDDGDNWSSSSSEYFTCEEDNISSTSSPGSEMSDSELDVVETELNHIFMDLQLLSRRLQQANTSPNQTMQSDIGRFQKKLLHTDDRIKKMFY
ncbi:hypothetical protein HNY73_017600 [Argiope bruennichi]|uniref:Uncharacterized protein n=1 Tax=Argiope bruennichi TaxID=94029 RepID=A0A8T0EAJ0_ARGBR|nr:hypothetical protein HNY73_017600 [Argiope bruennichi]